MGDLRVLFLEDGAQSAESVASWLADLVATAKTSLDLAIYDFHLEGPAADTLVEALDAKRRAGVRLRIAYNQPKVLPREGVVGEPARPDDTAAFLAARGLSARPVGDQGTNLMHHKYLLVDAGTRRARVWTGSANLTLAAFTRQENNLLSIASPPIVDAYAADFEELWASQDITGTGAHDGARGAVRYAGSAAHLEVGFAPGHGRAIDQEVADRIRAARRRVTIAAMVLTSGHVLGALDDVARRRIPIEGVVDGQMTTILDDWRRSPESAWKADTFAELARYGDLREKRSARAWPAGPHDYMHDKVIVVDDTVITGSYNYSVHAESNAENILFIESAALARDYRAHIERIVRRYPPANVRPGP
jgi:phosphatidylserine/phosphatidylglycerophosphate/cardiolipin synthase-like enzyme